MNELNALPRVKALTATSAGAANTSVAIQPAEGKIWRILYAWGFHTAGGARAAAWYWIDPETPAGGQIGASLAALAANSPVLIGGLVAVGAEGGDITAIKQPVYATNSSYPTFTWTALAGGEVGYVKALVLEYSATGKLGLG